MTFKLDQFYFTFYVKVDCNQSSSKCFSDSQDSDCCIESSFPLYNERDIAQYGAVVKFSVGVCKILAYTTQFQVLQWTLPSDPNSALVTEKPPLEVLNLGLSPGQTIGDISIWDHALILVSSNDEAARASSFYSIVNVTEC